MKEKPLVGIWMESRSVKRVVGFVKQEKSISKYGAKDVAF